MKRDTSQQAVNERLDKVIQGDCTRDLVTLYFETQGPFAGATFDTLSDPDADPNRFTVSDLLALTLLDVVLKPHVVRRLVAIGQRLLTTT